jgi:LAS superfamily LD-carboxypeptidase LdcB
VKNEMNNEYPYIDLTYIMGQFDPAKDQHFVKIDEQYADRPGLYLHKETYDAFIKMYEAASKAGLKLEIKSATRNFDYQKGIWERKWKGVTKLEGNIDASSYYKKGDERALAILRYSSMPGTSRHHWGTDIDINAFTNSYFESGKGKTEYDWLRANAANYGFCQPYTPKGPDRPHGYEEEKWHWSYLPIATICTEVAQEKMKDKLVKGFLGAEQAAPISVVKNYVLGVNTSCLLK